VGGLLGLALGILTAASALAGDPASDPQAYRSPERGLFGLKKRQTAGTLGYGPPGLHPGFQGFGLGYHLGNGYGGAGLGVGSEGGFPFYGGPGYPHPAPRLNRHLATVPFAWYGGPGGPTPTCPQYYGDVGPLSIDQPVISVVGTPGEAPYGQGFGAYTGAAPYPESAFAPFTAALAAGRASVEVTPARSAPKPPAPGPDTPAMEGARARLLPSR
jgi:hypothetical protein